MKAETVANTSRLQAFTEQVDRVEDVVGKLSGKDGTNDFRLAQVEQNTAELRKVTGELQEFRGSTKEAHGALKESMERLSREVGGIHRMLANMVQGGDIHVMKQLGRET